jgi:hypothetical protein
MTNVVLASGQITQADQLIVELIQATETPTTILIRWPAAPSVTDPCKFGAVAGAWWQILAEARAALARHRADEI